MHHPLFRANNLPARTLSLAQSVALACTITDSSTGQGAYRRSQLYALALRPCRNGTSNVRVYLRLDQSYGVIVNIIFSSIQSCQVSVRFMRYAGELPLR